MSQPFYCEKRREQVDHDQCAMNQGLQIFECLECATSGTTFSEPARPQKEKPTAIQPDDTLRCSLCKKFWPEDDFRRNKNNPSRRVTTCKHCEARYPSLQKKKRKHSAQSTPRTARIKTGVTPVAVSELAFEPDNPAWRSDRNGKPAISLTTVGLYMNAPLQRALKCKHVELSFCSNTMRIGLAGKDEKTPRSRVVRKGFVHLGSFRVQFEVPTEGRFECQYLDELQMWVCPGGVK